MKPVVFEYVLKGQVDKELDKVKLSLRGIGDESYTSFKGLASGSNYAHESVKRLAAGLGSLFALHQVTGFVKKMIDVRSEFQNAEAAMKVFLGSGEKATSFMKEMQSYAFNNVFEFKDLTEQATQLLAYKNEAKDIIPIIDKLSNVAAGVNQPLERFVELYNKAKSKNKLDLTDIQQWSVMGDVVSYLADMLGKSRNEIQSMVSAGRIGFKEINQLLNQLTESGGLFHGMMEEKMKTLGDSVGLLSDSITSMFNELGERSEDFLRGGILTANELVENYETVGKTLLSLIATYGVYRVALAVVTEAAAKHTAAEVIRIRTLVAARRAQQLLTASMLTNPYVLAATAIAGLASALVLFNRSAKTTADIVDSLKLSTDNYSSGLQKLTTDISRYDELQAKTKTAASLSKAEHSELNAIMERMLTTVPGLKAEFDEYGNILSINAEVVKSFAAAQKDAYKDVLENDIAAANERKKVLEEKLEEQRKVFQEGVITRTTFVQTSSLGTSRAVTSEGEATQKEKNKAREEWKKLSGELLSLNTEISNSGKVLDGIIIDTADTATIEAIVKNKAHWEAIKKGAEEAISALDESARGTEEWIKQQNIYNEAVLKLKKYDLSSKSLRQDENIEQKKLDAAQKLLEKNRQLASDRLQLDNDLEQKRIDLMNDGFAKREAANELNYKKDLEAADRYAEELLKKLQEAERLEWEKQGSPGVFKSTITVLPPDAMAQVAALKQAAKDAYDSINQDIADDLTLMWQEERIRFADELTKQLAEIESYYKERIKQAEGNEELISALIKNKQTDIEQAIAASNIKQIQFDSELAMRRMEICNGFYLFASTKRKKQLEEQKQAADKELSILEEMYSQTPTLELEQQIRELKMRQAEYNKELENMPAVRLKEALGLVKSLSSALGGLGGEIGEIFSAVAGQIDNIEVAFDKTASMTDRISAGVSGLVSVVSMISSAAAKRKEAEREFYKNAIAFAHEYALALNDQLRLQSELSSSGFVTDYAGKINDGFAALTDATRGYEESLAKLSEGKAKVDLRNAIDWGNIGKGLAGGAAAGAAIGSIVPVIGTVIGGAIGGLIGGIAGLFGGKKKKTQYAGLLEIFPELVDGAGNLNKELAQTLVATDQVDDNTKQLIQNALDWADAVETAQAQIREVVADLAGDLGNNLRSAIVDAWKAGGDASEAMFERASASLEKFVEQLLYSTIFGDVFKEFEDDLVASLNPDSGDGDVVDDFERFMDKMDKRDETYVALLDAVKSRAKQKGFTLWESDAEKEEASVTGSSKGIKAVSQDSFNEGMGRLTALVIYSAEGNKTLTDISSQMSDASDKLAVIAENTAHCKRLEQIEKDMKATKQSLSNIELKGITLKK